MGGQEARAFMKWTVGGTPSSNVKRDKTTQDVVFERPKRHNPSKNASSSHSQASSRTSSHRPTSNWSSVYDYQQQQQAAGHPPNYHQTSAHSPPFRYAQSPTVAPSEAPSDSFSEASRNS
ncbi:hypothetical protein F5Y10DRAFT_262579 [Nemania abortiva]|nr:hypothetical protein F5Y10DRAFT_262579 [Nemania abortiva]